jgi:rhodanese-related sulfurtransferase
MQTISYSELKKRVDEKSCLLIDVREKHELAYGMIPSAHHIPLGEIEAAFKMEESEFEQQYHFSKPKKGSEIIFYCRSGNRSAFAADAAQRLGYASINYVGSVLEWSRFDTNVNGY